MANLPSYPSYWCKCSFNCEFYKADENLDGYWRVCLRPNAKEVNGKVRECPLKKWSEIKEDNDG